METSDGVKNIDEVVMTGYGIKRELATTASSVSTVSDMISGTVPGLEITRSGKDADIRIRGMSSVNGSVKQPLVVVNGILTTIDGLKEINPERIKQVTVLKSEESTALYGSRAVNGVVIVKAKRLRRAEKVKLEELYSKSMKEVEKKL